MKKCLYCREDLDQGSAHKECLNCGFPIKGTLAQVLPLAKKKRNKRLKIISSILGFFVILGIMTGGLQIGIASVVLYGGAYAIVLYDYHIIAKRFNNE